MRILRIVGKTDQVTNNVLQVFKSVCCLHFLMGEKYKTCELHRKPFPNNLVDSTKTELLRLYVERKQEIEGKNQTLTMFVGDRNENEGIDVCIACLQELVLNNMEEKPLFKGIVWNKVTMTKKDGSGTYDKNEKTILTIDEIKHKIQEEKKAIPAK